MACRISYKAGHWYASISVKINHTNPPLKIEKIDTTKEKTLGIDLGIKTLATLSDGRKFENQKLLEKSHKKVARLQRKLARRKIGGKNLGKVVLKLGKAYENVSNLRGELYHQTVNAIVDGDYDVIGIENLNVAGIMKNHKLARAIADASFGEFIRILKYKAEPRGISVVEVGRFYPSTQICNDCKFQNKELTLIDREWTCPNCGKPHDRVENASFNLRDKAIHMINRAKHTSALVVKEVVSPDVKTPLDRS